MNEQVNEWSLRNEWTSINIRFRLQNPTLVIAQIFQQFDKDYDYRSSNDSKHYTSGIFKSKVYKSMKIKQNYRKVTIVS